MISVSVSTLDAEKTTKTNKTEQPARHKTVVICGACGAEEEIVEDNKTECPNCDEYIY